MHSILAARTDFSVGESILTTKFLIKNAVDAGAKAVAMTDTMSITGMIDFTNKAKAAELKPVIGVRLRLVDNPTWRPGDGEKKKDMPRGYFLTVYALKEAGMKAIFRLLSLGNSDTRFYYEPKLGFEDLYNEIAKLDSNDVAIVLGDAHSVLEHPDARDIVSALTFALDRVYAPLLPVDTPYYGRLNELALHHMKLNNKVKPIVVRPAFYGQGEADTQEIMTAIADNNKVTDGWFKSRHNRDMHVMGNAELVGEMKKAVAHLEKRGATGSAAHFKQGLLNTAELVNAVEYEWKKADVSLPVMSANEFQSVVEECKKGWKERFSEAVFGHQPEAADLVNVYKPRLAYELETLKRLNFSGYFLLVQDTVQFAKSNGILVGPGRGSVGGSLVAYLMGITDCDPIRFGLLFERFINPERIDLPDADLDFMSERRHEVVEYLTKKYGKDRVAGVANFGTLASASTIRDVGRVTNIPEKDYSVSKFVPKLHGQNVSLPDSRKAVPEIDDFACNYPVHWPIMERLEGTIRNFGQHAAGIVVGGCDLVERAVITRGKEGSVVCWDKRIVEDQGLVKMDILGLTTLDLIKLTTDYVRENSGKRLDLNRIPLDDEKVLANFAKANTTAVFQFESGGMRRLLKELGWSGSITFEDITAATALYRPGPMESGMMDSFYLRKQGHEPIEYDHPIMEPVLEETFGVIVYQEQVMKISQVIAGYSGAAADKLRKIMGKKLPEEMKKERKKFCDGCVATIACTEEWAGELFDKIEGFAGYGFNKSHSVEYTLISYQAMYLKTYHPAEFYAAALTMLKEEKLTGIIRDARQLGIDVSMPDINISTDRFEMATPVRLVMPLQRIKGISEKATTAILEARKTGPFINKADFLSRVEKRVCNVRVQNALDLVGAFSRIEPGQVPANDPSRIKDQIELLPGLIASHVPIGHELNKDKDTKVYLGELVDEYRAAHGPTSGAGIDGYPVKPFFGKSADFMIISDAPGNEEDTGGVMGFSMSNNAVVEAIESASLDRSNAYWTALIKRPKRGKQVTPDEIAMYAPYLEREIELLNPPIIVLMGSTTTRHFLPDFKGKASDQAGTVIYSKKYDANLVVGFSPGEIYHDPDKQQNMNDVFAAVADCLA
ncbi:DNA polymerase III subunit alpha [Ensifer sp. ENS10]|uniref:DNA polymerase III subunit alpha n=1 Tax=Ensifer sp. ENS10 TaxID=2769286 RepID=UPI001784DBD0|nr:DNA polymerase III subunit alpha [Ensifer sp. ENS10]MBD9511666.1 DNA polymerase III subunit alpha [Ensifer sp. ENS10]